jgi:EAL domain-containing protein (putative c-di-GMP-specific phosphodiesterase class I)/DNA-binding NarL/FixJ family response regulator
MTEIKIKVLVIDDHEDLTTMVRDVLESRGYEVLTANTGERGLEIAFTEHPDLILLDVMMPGMDGYQVCRELQFGYTKDIPVIFLTAKTQLASMMEANRSGASAFITKPFRVEHLVQTVRDVLRDASVYYDEITGLPTLANVQVEVQRQLANHNQLGLIYISLDGVYGLEQVQGFEAVDEVFRIVGQKLVNAKGAFLRDEDFVSISSLGNAFLIMLAPSREQSSIDEQNMRMIKDRLESNLLQQLEDELEEKLLAKIAVYVGYARLSQSPKVRFKRALLEAIEEATRGIQVEREETYGRLVHELDRVLADEQITCVYQPIVDLQSFDVLGYEVLARGPIQSALHRPDVLFDVARDQGRVEELDRVCRVMAARGGATLPDDALRFINTEPVNLFFRSRSDLFVEEFVSATPEPLRSKTVMEITEKSIIDDFGHFREVVTQLRERGFRIAIDDAGAGYSGLQTMVEIEPDFIKLDISLIRGLDTSVVKQKLIKTLRTFCVDAGITLIAEGIETEEQLAALKELQIPYGQGYLFAYPGSPYPLKDRIDPLTITENGDLMLPAEAARVTRPAAKDVPAEGDKP